MVIASTGSITLGATEKEVPVAQVGLTADEAFADAQRLFIEKKYHEAAAVYSKFREDYGKSAEAETALRNSLYPLAYCHMALKDYPRAVSAITEAIAATPPLAPERLLELQFWLGVSCFQTQDAITARESLEKFISMAEEGTTKSPLFKRLNPIANHIPEARLMSASTWLAEGKHREAADHFTQLIPL